MNRKTDTAVESRSSGRRRAARALPKPFASRCPRAVILFALLNGAGARDALAEQHASTASRVGFTDLVPADARAALWIDQPKAFYEQLAAGEAGRLVADETSVRGYLQGLAGMIKLALTVTTGVPIERVLNQASDGLGLIVLNGPRRSDRASTHWVLVVDARNQAGVLKELLRHAPGAAPDRRGQAGLPAILGPVASAVERFGLDRVTVRERDGWLLSGVPRDVRLVLATMDRRQPTLAQRSAWRAIRQACPIVTQPHALFYISTASSWRPTATQAASERPSAGPGQLLGTDCVRALGGTCRIVDGRVVARELVVMDEPSTGALGMLRACKPVSLEGARFMPADVDLFCAMNLGGGKAISDAFWSRVAPLDAGLAHSVTIFRGSARGYGADFYKEFLLRFTGDMVIGCRLPDATRAIGSVPREWLLALDPIVAIRVRDPEKIMPAWQRFATAGMVAVQGVRWETERGGPHTMHVLRAHGRPILGMEITFAFVGETWLITLSAERMRAALEAGSGEPNLAGTAAFRACMKGTADGAGIITYANPSRWCDRVATLLDERTTSTPAGRDTASRGAEGLLASLRTSLGRTGLPGVSHPLVAFGLVRMLRGHTGLDLTVRNHPEGLLVTSRSPFGEAVLAHLALLGG